MTLDRPRSGEADNRRPAVVVSNDGANPRRRRAGGVVTVVPITSNAGRIYPFQVRSRPGRGGLPVGSNARAEQVRSVAVERLGVAGRLPPRLLAEVDEALLLHLGL